MEQLGIWAPARLAETGEETSLGGEADEVGMALEAELALKIRSVRLGGAGTDGETDANLGVVQALGSQLQHLALTRSQQVVPVRRLRHAGGQAGVTVDRSLRKRRAQVPSTVHDGIDRNKQIR